jgi:hypothetical protein
MDYPLSSDLNVRRITHGASEQAKLKIRLL